MPHYPSQQQELLPGGVAGRSSGPQCSLVMFLEEVKGCLFLDFHECWQALSR